MAAPDGRCYKGRDLIISRRCHEPDWMKAIDASGGTLSSSPVQFGRPAKLETPANPAGMITWLMITIAARARSKND